MIDILFDTETTGLIKPDATDINAQPYITEIYCLKIFRSGGGCEIIGDFEQQFNIPIPVPAEITKITGITDEDLINKPNFALMYKELSEFFIGVNRLVAHNCAFDAAMLANELVRIDKVIKFPWPPEHFCTVQKTLHLQQRRLNLQSLHNELFGCGFENAHRAKTDVMAMYSCYKKLVDRGIA